MEEIPGGTRLLEVFNLENDTINVMRIDCLPNAPPKTEPIAAPRSPCDMARAKQLGGV